MNGLFANRNILQSLHYMELYVVLNHTDTYMWKSFYDILQGKDILIELRTPNI